MREALRNDRIRSQSSLLQGDDMATRRMRPALHLACFLYVVSGFALAQNSPLTLGPLTVTIPPGWTGQANSIPARIFSPGSNPQKYFSVEFFPPEQTPQEITEHHSQIWGKLAAAFRITAPPVSGLTGRFVWTRSDVPRGFGQKETFILYSTKVGSTYVGVAVHATNPDLVARNLPAMDAMLRGAVLSEASSAPGPSAPSYGSGNSGGATASAGNPGTLGEYIYSVPQGWAANQYADGIVLTSPVSQTGERCLISLWPMRAAGANLQDDANIIFRDIFKTYVLKNQTSSGSLLQSSMVRGTSGQGWDYLMVKRGIAKPGGQYETLLGFVLVARLDNRLAVISGLSKEPLISACMGELTGSTVWPRFFYSLGFKNWRATDQVSAMRRRLAGSWTAATASAADQITFAGNGRYANAAAAQQYYRISSTELLTTTQAYFGNGSYALRGNAVTLTQDDRKNQPENGFLRVEEESKDEGRSWTEALYVLRTSAVDGNDYEVKYSKR
jgi:hypothetical protein